VNKITITNDKGRLSTEDIERMVAEAEKFKAEDEANREKVEAKNKLENYAYSLRNSISDEKVAGMIPEEDKTTITSACDEAIAWIEANPVAEKEEFEEQYKKLEGTCSPIMARLGGGAGGAPGGMPGGAGGMPGGGFPGAGGMPGAAPGGFGAASTDAPPPAAASSGPKIEEVD